MPKNPAIMFYTGDWLKDPELSLCEPATRGIWIDLLCAMHELDRCGQVSGTPEQLSRLARCTSVQMSAAIAELKATKAANVTERNGIVTIANRRMQVEYKKRVGVRERVYKHRGKRDSNTSLSSSSSNSVTEDCGANAPQAEAAAPLVGEKHPISDERLNLWKLRDELIAYLKFKQDGKPVADLSGQRAAALWLVEHGEYSVEECKACLDFQWDESWRGHANWQTVKKDIAQWMSRGSLRKGNGDGRKSATDRNFEQRIETERLLRLRND